ATATSDDQHALLDERFDNRQLANTTRCRAANDAPQLAMPVGLHDVSVSLQLLGPLTRQTATNELRGISQRGICRIDLDLRDDRRDASWAAGADQRVLQRLLNHIADPTGSRRHQNAQRKRACLTPSNLVAHAPIADLRTVAI